MFLQKIGGGYKFTHDLLKEHLALTNLDSSATSKKLQFPRGKLFQVGISLASLCLMSICTPLAVDSWGVDPKLAQIMPKFQENNRLIVDTLTYRFGNIKSGDIISFQPTDNLNKECGWIGQVVGIPGETIEVKEEEIYIGNNLLSNFDSLVSSNFKLNGSRKLDQGLYLVLVNNSNSKDSKFIGCFVPHSHITGRVAFRFWPPSQIGLIK
jgi:signal peptidase I